jgi:hypothetical protein
MLSKKDIAIKYAITRPKIINTFWSHTIIDENGCLVWTLGTNPAGYSRLCVSLPKSKDVDKRQNIDVIGHRLAYALHHGFDALPKGFNGTDTDKFVINHICHNRLCVNVEHLEVITQKQNTSVEKKRPRKPNDAIIADNLEDFMEQIRNTERE